MADFSLQPGYWQLSRILVETTLAADTTAALALIPTIQVNGEAVVDADPWFYVEDTITIDGADAVSLPEGRIKGFAEEELAAYGDGMVSSDPPPVFFEAL